LFVAEMAEAGSIFPLANGSHGLHVIGKFLVRVTKAERQRRVQHNGERINQESEKCKPGKTRKMIPGEAGVMTLKALKR
jgi:hypothetical protein